MDWVGDILDGASAASNVGRGFLGLLGLLFGLNKESLDIDKLRDEILKVAVRVDKRQSHSDTEKRRARNNICTLYTSDAAHDLTRV